MRGLFWLRYPRCRLVNVTWTRVYHIEERPMLATQWVQECRMSNEVACNYHEQLQTLDGVFMRQGGLFCQQI